MRKSFFFRYLADRTDQYATLVASRLSLLRMSLTCLRGSSLRVSCFTPRRPSLLIRTCLVFRGLGSTLPRVQCLHQRDIWFIWKRNILLIARSTTVDDYTTTLYLESYSHVLSFAVVTFPIIKSVRPPPRHSFVISLVYHIIPYQTWTIHW
jgi:hypothetical protein